MPPRPPTPQGGVPSPAPTARAAGAVLMGVGLHPLALVAYEALHLGRSPRLVTLLTLAIALLAGRQLAEVSQAALHPLWWVAGHGALTAWWIQGVYRGAEGPMVHGRGLLAGLAVGALLWGLRALSG
jgi:hypothetical protein